jgi:hypothetical protein
LKHSSRKRFFGAVASLAAAYALVLNVVLSSMLLAAMSPTAMAAGFEICANNPDFAAAHDDAGKQSGKPALHCPVCVGHHAPAAPPSPVAWLVSRVAVTIAPAFAPDIAFVAHPAHTSHQARAPPRLS